MEACCSLVSPSLPRVSLAGNQISGRLRQLGRGEFNSSLRPRKLCVSQRLYYVSSDGSSLVAVAVAKVANEVKAADIRVLFVKPLGYWTRFFIIATAFSRPQTDAIGSKIRDLAEKQYGKVDSGDTKPNSWTLLDFGDVVVHIFLPEQRDFYNLEEFYGNATLIDLPFENQPPFRS
ncbi:protein Iojap, chloroplastic-like isoform X1 [Actinidia eriantha]|uniref:protein Iojap, chloroplastic-like isoform X1 n=1 Tax=Actinidia eriantha TaxID=165200 RepID=UPI002585BFF1|nr:protein Iojap, chloroplastic-like isoform X1 [Actinidia eriantha]